MENTLNEACKSRLKVNSGVSASAHAEDSYEHASLGLVYIDTSVPGVSVDEELFYSRPKGCECRSACDATVCACIQRSGGGSSSDAASKAGRMNPIFECNSDCTCDVSCLNRATQKGPRRALKVVSVPNKGLGVVTEEDIPEGDFVCEYAGEVIGEPEARRRLKALQPSEANYILVLQEYIAHATKNARIQTTVIDPTVIGNIGRYLNHSCDPNLCVVPIRCQSLVPIAAMFATRLIRKGEEICYNYNSGATSSDDNREEEEENEGKPCSQNVSPSSSKCCHCLASKCAGSLPRSPCLFE